VVCRLAVMQTGTATTFLCRIASAVDVRPAAPLILNRMDGGVATVDKTGYTGTPRSKPPT
jgi:hypothetical protein